MTIPIERASLPSPPSPDQSDSTLEQRIDNLEGLLRSLIGSLDRYGFVPSEYAENEITTLDDVAQGVSNRWVSSTYIDSDGVIVDGSITATSLKITDIPTASLNNTAGWTTDATANTALSTANTANANANTAITNAATAQGILNNWGADGGTTYIDGGDIKTGTIIAGAIGAGTIGAVLIYVGADLIMNTTGKIYSTGKTTHDSSTAGYFLGYESSKYVFGIGDGTNYLRWNGTTLSYTGVVGASYTNGAILTHLTSSDSGFIITTNHAYSGEQAKRGMFGVIGDASTQFYVRSDNTTSASYSIVLDTVSAVYYVRGLDIKSCALDSSCTFAGTWTTDNIPNLAASKITSGDLASARITGNIGDLVKGGSYTGTGSGTKNIAHGLGRTPKYVVIICTGHTSYSGGIYAGSTTTAITAVDGTNITVSGTTAPYGLNVGVTYEWLAFG